MGKNVMDNSEKEHCGDRYEEILKPHKKEIVQDYEFKKEKDKKRIINDLGPEFFSRKKMLRVFAKDIIFRDINFSQSDFLDCYFRKCRFIKCSFVGVAFKDSNMQGSKFEGCDFSYATFKNTIVDDSILDDALPSYENIQRHFVRSLRINFSQIGNQEAVNRSIAIELEATKIHYKKSVFSREFFYREKYRGFERFQMFLKYSRFLLLDFIWGNGESPYQLVKSFIFCYLLFYFYLYSSCSSDSFVTVAKLLIVGPSSETPPILSIFSSLVKTIYFGLFMSIIIRRLARR